MIRPKILWMPLCFLNGVVMALSSSPSTPIPPPPPISVPVWCLAAPSLIQKDTRTRDTNKPFTSMSIVTFATPVSVAPPKQWAVSLYHDTLTKDSFLLHKGGVLQLLSSHQKTLVPVLGMRSGYEEDYHKQRECAALGYDWMLPQDATDVELLPKCATYIKLRLLSTVDAGDHAVALCEVVGTYTYDNDKESIVLVPEGSTPSPIDEEKALYTSLLRKEKII